LDETSKVDRELKLRLAGVRVFFVVLAILAVLAIALGPRLAHGPHPYGDGVCTVTGGVGECIMP
jgi:hypothetical protein